MKRFAPVITLGAVLIVTAGPARLSGTPGQSAPAFRSAASLVALNVTVQDAKSHYVGGLQPADFVVFEDGVKQEIRFFETTSLPIDLILLLDTSLSMSGNMDIVRDAARGVLGTLRPGDRAAVVAFNDGVKVLQPLTCEVDPLVDAVYATDARGNTALHNAVYIALKQFGLAIRSSGAVRRQAIIVLSDGEDTASTLSFEDVLGVARQTGVNVYTVRLQDTDLIREGDARMQRLFAESEYEMKTLARETGGLSFSPLLDQLQNVYAAIANELANQYSIGYEPARGGNDGRFHHIGVQIVSRPGLRARTRSGYTANLARTH